MSAAEDEDGRLYTKFLHVDFEVGPVFGDGEYLLFKCKTRNEAENKWMNLETMFTKEKAIEMRDALNLQLEHMT